MESCFYREQKKLANVELFPSLLWLIIMMTEERIPSSNIHPKWKTMKYLLYLQKFYSSDVTPHQLNDISPSSRLLYILLNSSSVLYKVMISLIITIWRQATTM